MKKLGFFNKIILFFNSIFAMLLLLSYVIPYMSPKTFPVLSVLSLMVPILIIINLLFFFYWIIRLKRPWILSCLVLLIGFKHLNGLYKFGGNSHPEQPEDLSVMSYNVRLFNLYDWIKDASTEEKIVNFIKKENPDVLCLQEFHVDKKSEFGHYPFSHVKLRSTSNKAGQAIFSKFEIINTGSLDFPNTTNNGIYVDIVKGEDTVRVYNLHLESMRIADPNNQELSQENSERLVKRISRSFVKQQFQAEVFDQNQKQCPYNKIVAGDFNNTQYSNIYKRIRGDMNDAFNEAGSGFGRTFKFKFFPVRIDFILTSDEIQVKDFRNYDQEFSDHYPVFSIVRLP